MRVRGSENDGESEAVGEGESEKGVKMREGVSIGLPCSMSWV